MDDKNFAEILPNDGAKKETEMKLRRLTLFSSGVGFFEHNGDISGNVEFTLTFNKDAVNDALKSIVINDPDANPVIFYHSEDTLLRTLKGLSIDLHENDYIAELLSELKGAEIEVFAPNSIKGRIMLVEDRRNFEPETKTFGRDAFLTLFASDGIRVLSIKEINRFLFTDPKINADIDRVLDLIMQSRNSDAINLSIKLPGQKMRKVSLSYVTPTPVWKVSYRLDLSQEMPFLQGWAIVDNDSDMDWEQVELALVTGKPVSFIQNLYAPYRLARPTIPLAIAGIAKANVYESGTPETNALYTSQMPFAAPLADMVEVNQDTVLPIDYDYCYEEEADFPLGEGMVETAQGRAAGDQFEFTIKYPVSLARQQSAMLPLVEGAVCAKKMLIYSGSKELPGKISNPAIGAELTNNTGMKLPAGAITVYDGKTYAGDALIKFFPEGEKRIISYGEDLSVTCSFAVSSNRVISAISIKGGIMLVKTKVSNKRVYTFRNASNESKRLIVEHPFNSKDALLVAPSEYMEKSNDLYRFELNLLQGELNFEVIEEELQLSDIVLSTMPDRVFVRYVSDQEIHEDVRIKLKFAIDLKQKINTETEKLDDLKNKLTHFLDEQERTRENLEASGVESQQGKNYLVRLELQDKKIDKINEEIFAAGQSVKDAQNTYDRYIQEMDFGDGFIIEDKYKREVKENTRSEAKKQKYERCKNGHFYDLDRFDKCPYCRNVKNLK
ncbi:MAG: DUF4139 domain-containing protein [Oscillospiraceae bacterium]|nr:DUF4139 domain-containing protein [Oscillospiraceae bacterium]